MRRRLRNAIIAALIAMGLAPIAAGAQSVNPVQPQFTYPWTACAVATAAAVTCVVPGGSIGQGQRPQLFIGLFNNSATAQTISLSCTDGTTTWNFGAAGINQQVTFPQPGWVVQGTFICTPSGAPTGAIILQLR